MSYSIPTASPQAKVRPDLGKVWPMEAGIGGKGEGRSLELNMRFKFCFVGRDFIVSENESL